MLDHHQKWIDQYTGANGATKKGVKEIAAEDGVSRERVYQILRKHHGLGWSGHAERSAKLNAAHAERLEELRRGAEAIATQIDMGLKTRSGVVAEYRLKNSEVKEVLDATGRGRASLGRASTHPLPPVQVYRLHLMGYGIYRIAKAMGHPRKAVRVKRILQKLGVYNPQTYYHWIDGAKVMRQIKRGLSYRYIARLNGCHVSSIYYYAKKLDRLEAKRFREQAL